MEPLDFNQQHGTSYCIPLYLRDQQVRLAIERVKGRIQPHELREEPAAIIGFGPSLNDTWRQAAKFKHIFTCSGAHKFMRDHGVAPTKNRKWVHIEVDPRPHKVQLIGPPHKDIEYLIASTCHPKVFEHLEGCDVKLWHVFDNAADGLRLLPHGDWSITGGTDVSMRAITLARFLGFTNLHIFGVDGNCKGPATHAAEHPNRPKVTAPCDYEGKTYQTTPALLQCAKQVFHELDQLPGVTAKFYGEGLVQHMARSYKPKPIDKDRALIGFTKPELISREYRELNASLHRDNPTYGVGGAKHADTVLKLAKSLKQEFVAILDYGAGKGELANNLPFPIAEYDPAIPGKQESPKPADLVVSTDVLEHVEPDKLMYVLDDLRRCTKNLAYFVIHTGPSTKTLSDGRNAHLIQQPKEWWAKRLRKFFNIPDNGIIERPPLLYVVATVKTQAAPDSIAKVQRNGTTAQFFIPNETTKWRAETLLTKEPVTIEWINGMERGDVLYDVGANVGGYAVWAGVQGVKVHAFEPEAENYALLVRNLALNGISPNAYCLALTDRPAVGPLYLSQTGAGGSCHSFGEAVGPDLQPRQGPQQGCVGTTLDELVERGLPSPDHLKIDVDGLEFRVIKGAEHVLQNGLKSLLVEVNPNLPEHLEMVRFISELGFTYEQSQVDAATRKDGPFKGVAEYVFRKDSGAVKRLIARLRDVKVQSDPFPYFYAEDVLDYVLHDELVKTLPKKYTPIKKVRGVNYPKRFVAQPEAAIWKDLQSALRSGAFKKALCEKFGVDPEGLTDETLLIKDRVGYSIGPHTDHPDKVISALFYLQGEEGTSLYVPRKEGFTCPGGPHYPFNKFKRVATMPFKPNSLFVFLKSDHSFHGVETTKHQRDVLLYDIRKHGPNV